MKKKPTAKTLRNKADRLWSLAVRSRGRCEKCGKPDGEVTLQGAHIVPRRYLKTRWDLDNGLALCSACHVYFTHFPLEFEELVTDHIGAEAFADLKVRARGTAGKVDYEAVLERLSA